MSDHPRMRSLDSSIESTNSDSNLCLSPQRLGVRMSSSNQIVMKRRVVDEQHVVAATILDLPDDELSFEPLVLAPCCCTKLNLNLQNSFCGLTSLIPVFQILWIYPGESSGSDACVSEEQGPDPANIWKHPFAVASRQKIVQYCEIKSLDSRCVVVEPFLAKFMREHQRQGVQFMYDCVTGIRPADGLGCILADDMVQFCSFRVFGHSLMQHFLCIRVCRDWVKRFRVSR